MINGGDSGSGVRVAGLGAVSNLTHGIGITGLEPSAIAWGTRVTHDHQRGLEPGRQSALSVGAELTSEEVRVLGALVEKQRTTPDQYPLSLNALRLACNQSTNRDPVVEFDEPTIREALERLSRRRWVRLASGAGSRATKYRHLLDEALDLSVAEMSVLAVLMLRGPADARRAARPDRAAPPVRRPGRAEGDPRAASRRRELVAGIGRRPGQKEERYDSSWVTGASPKRRLPRPSLEERVARLEAEVERLKTAVQSGDSAVKPGLLTCREDEW